MEDREIKYIGYYDTEANRPEDRYHVLAASDKMDYILSVLNRLGSTVQVVSACTTRSSRGFSARVVPLSGGNTLRLFRTFPWGGKTRRVISVLSLRLFLLLWLLTNTTRGEDVIVYHSLGYASVVALAKRARGFRLILEVEEIYADVTGRPRDRRMEDRVFRQADAFIFPTELLAEKLNKQDRPHAIVHGVYQSEAANKRGFGDGRIHVVYAGTFDPRKGGSAAAAAAGLFLDGRYHVHIIGFGDDAETESLLDAISDVSARTACRVTHDGLLAGEEYVRFLQSCDVGLSTQTPHAGFSDSSFPSKVLSYMANGLRVVSVRLKALEMSGVGDMLLYYDDDTPQAIADAIRSMDLTRPYDCEGRLQQLDREFQRDLKELLSA